jgi:hypothetical protein
MRLIAVSALGICGAILFMTTCSAATVESVRGQLSVNKGLGFEPVNGRVVVKMGDSVMVSPDGAAIVTYPDGCKVDVQPGAVTTIVQLSPCASGSNAQDQSKNYMLPTVFGGTVLGVFGVVGYEISKSTSTTGSGSATAPATTPASP